jgi:hypothetical protein
LQIRTSLNEFRGTKAKQHQGRLDEIDKSIAALQEKRAMVTGAMQEVEASFTSRIKELDALMANLPKDDGPAAAAISLAEVLANTLADSKGACLQQMEVALNGRLTPAGQSLDFLTADLQKQIYEAMWGVVATNDVAALAGPPPQATPQAMPAAASAAPAAASAPLPMSDGEEESAPRAGLMG